MTKKNKNYPSLCEYLNYHAPEWLVTLISISLLAGLFVGIGLCLGVVYWLYLMIGLWALALFPLGVVGAIWISYWKYVREFRASKDLSDKS